MKMRRPNFSSEHFSWLVDGRSRNQRSTVELYRLIEEHEDVISQNFVLHDFAQSLAAIAFSLWRAVFLSDLSGGLGDQMVDLKLFLQSLIAHNTVLYQTDFSSREWSFTYYLDHANFRLNRLGEQLGKKFDPLGNPQIDKRSPKDDWIVAQLALEAAISRFEEAIRRS